LATKNQVFIEYGLFFFVAVFGVHMLRKRSQTGELWFNTSELFPVPSCGTSAVITGVNVPIGRRIT
jgi:hypothetical protein